MIWLANGASALYQWERGVTVNCDKPCDVLSIWREDDKKSVRIVPTAVQGVYRTEIPRQLLQQSGYLRFEAIDAADDGERIIDTARIIIRPRRKPDDYPANGQESEYWQSLQLRMDALERKAREGDFKGDPGDDGITPHVGANGNWFLGEVDTGVHASGVEGAPYIGENENWWFNGVDSGVQARGERGEPGESPYIGANGNWFVEGKDTGVTAQTYFVGDIKETMRDDPGDDWLLCNGAGIPEGEFPALREMIPYNTAWVEAVPENEYMHVSPIPNTHKWVRVKRKVDSSTYAWDKAEVYDAETRTSLTVECPLVVSDKTVKLVGITHDGVKYVMAACCYGEKTSSRETMHLYASDDLITWKEIYTYTFTDTIYPSDFAFNGVEYMLADGYVPSDGSTSSNYTRYSWVTPADLSKTEKRNAGSGSGYKDARYRPFPAGYYSWDSDNDSSVDIYRAGTGETVMSGNMYYAPKNVAFFNDRYIITVSHSTTGELSEFEVFDWMTETRTRMAFATLFDLPSDLGSRVYGYGAEYDPLLNEWSIYFRHSSTYYRARISADADPTVKENYSKTVVATAPSGLLSQMSLNRARWNGNEIRDPNLKYLPEQEGIKYMYIYGGKEHVGKPVELEYIESTGTQYINTGFTPNQDTRVVMTVKFQQNGGNEHLFGARTTSTSNTYGFSTYTNDSYRTHYNAGWLEYASTVTYSDMFTIDKDKNITVLNGTESITDVYTTFSAPCPLYLFANNTDGVPQTPASARLYDCKIYDNGTLVRDYVPCRRWNGKVCMYDRVSGEYHYNVGTGSFIAGPVVGELEETV